MALGLRVGEKVTVRSLDEVLATLDQDGRLDAMPFMPEMVSYCGREFTVLKRIDKVLDTAGRTGLRRMTDAVILDGNRCNGAAHGGCQALCQLIWKEAWLVRGGSKSGARPQSRRTDRISASAPNGGGEHRGCTEAQLTQLTRQATPSGEERFSCQATQVNKASSYLAWWDPRQDLRDLRSGNATVGDLIRYFCTWLVTLVSRRVVGGTRVVVPFFNAFQKLRGGQLILPRQGTLDKTPRGQLNLRPGELVRVKSHEEIVDTLDKRSRNRGLWFDLEMVKYCGGTYRVLSRVERIIDHPTGRMINLPNECVILEGVVARGDYRRFYPQYEYPFWREVWLTRVAQPGPDQQDRERMQAQTASASPAPSLR